MSHVNSAEAKVAAALQAAGINVDCNRFIDNYEVDIVIQNRLVIEVDGYHHCARANQKRDAVKDSRLQEAGYSIMRIRNADVHDPGKLQRFVQQVKLELSHHPGAAIPANTPMALPQLQQLREQLLARDQARQAAEQSRRRSPAPAVKRKSEQEVFLDWLDRQAITDKDEASPRRVGPPKRRR